MTNYFVDYFAAWESLDVDRLMGWFTDDIAYEDTTIGHGASGADQMRKFVSASFRNVPDARFVYVSHLATDTAFAVEWVMEPMGVRGLSIGALRDGKISAQRDYWNGAKYRVPNT
jgi:ketosteroid isomerase-like protein